jgi:Omp85 superfamily domain
MLRRLCTFFLPLSLLFVSPRVIAEELTQVDSTTPKPSSEPAGATPQTPARRPIQWAGVPIVGGNSDFGWGGGALLSVTKPSQFENHSDEWSAEMVAVAMFSTESLEPRFQDYYVKAVLDDVLGSGLRLTIRPSFTHIAAVNYYGLGNAAPRQGAGMPDPDGPERSYYDYMHADGTLRMFLAHDFSHQVRLSSGVILSYVWMDVPEDTRLAEDEREGSAEVRAELTGLDDHAFAAFVWSLEFDTRDNEVNPHHGAYQTATFTFAPGGAQVFTDTWARAFFALRLYQGFFKNRLVLAGRVLFDALAGTPPVYELSRFDNYSNAFGGEKGIRGIEAQRYYGKLKAIANFESRISLFDFKLIGHQTLIFTQFFDIGHLWADFSASEELDGSGLGLKYSVGGGLHLLFDDSFVVALDVGWSPDAQPVGVYLTSGHAF